MGKSKHIDKVKILLFHGLMQIRLNILVIYGITLLQMKHLCILVQNGMLFQGIYQMKFGILLIKKRRYLLILQKHLITKGIYGLLVKMVYILIQNIQMNIGMKFLLV